jgi:hypothetical protein
MCIDKLGLIDVLLRRNFLHISSPTVTSSLKRPVTILML